MAELLRLSEPQGEVKRHVIFVHGLDGDPRKTWTSPPPPPPDNRLWLTWLAADVDGLAVWSLGYEAPALEWRGSAMELADRAGNVLSLLEAENRLASGELIFVGHSLGGLVIKQLLRKASDAASRRTEALSLIERTRKVAFLATPHLGADLAGWGDRFRVLFRPSAAARVLLRNDQHLRDLNVWYRGWASEKEITHLILYETKTTSVFGMVVKPDSSDPGLASEAIAIDADHIHIAKPLGPDHQVYKLIRAFIEREAARPVTITERKIDALAAQIARKKGVPVEPLQAILAKLGEAGVAPETIPARLEAKADELIDLRKKLERLSNERPELSAIRQDALALIEHGEFDAARAALARGREAARALRADAGRSEAEFLADEARVDHLQLAYRAAATKYGEAARLVADFDSEGSVNWLLARAGELYAQGDEFGDNGALVEAVAAYRVALTEITQERVPLDWATTQNNLGVALATLGERESRTARLEEAVAAYRSALTERTQERVPLQWAGTQNNLGIALWRLGERQSGTARLEEAVAAYRSALTERTQERVPLQWAGTQNNLGNALWRLGERQSGTGSLEEAVAAYRAALTELTQARVPLQWAGAQNNLGLALMTLGERESGTTRLEEAVAAYRAALKEWTQERVPLQWAGTQNNLGNVLLTLRERERGQEEATRRLEEAVMAYRAALKEWTRERVPLQWAMTQNNLGNALRALGERESGQAESTRRLEQAVAAYRAALTERTRERVPLDWAMTQTNLGAALLGLGERESGQDESIRCLEAAVAAYRVALTERTRERVPLQWAMTQNNLGAALASLGERESRQDEAIRCLAEAIKAYRAALTERTRERVPLQWAMTQNNLGAALASLGERESRQDEAIRCLAEAVKAYRAALTERTRERVPLDWAMTQFNLAAALSALGERESGRERSIRHLEEAVVAYRAALMEWTKERVPRWHDRAQQNLARCLALLEQRRTS